jgi:hypothetical protein
MLELASSRWLDLVQTLMDWTDQHCRASHRRMRRRTPMSGWWHLPRLWSSTAPISAKASDHARSFGFGIRSDQTCKWGIEWDTCAPGLLSCVASDFPSSRLRIRMTQSWSFSPGTHISLQNKKKLAHPTRFERVTFALGEQTPTNPAVHRRRKLKDWPVFG